MHHSGPGPQGNAGPAAGKIQGSQHLIRHPKWVSGESKLVSVHGCRHEPRRNQGDATPREPRHNSAAGAIGLALKPQREPDVQHHRQANNLGARFEILERVAFCHTRKLSNRPVRLRPVCSDNADDSAPPSNRTWTSSPATGDRPAKLAYRETWRVETLTNVAWRVWRQILQHICSIIPAHLPNHAAR